MKHNELVHILLLTIILAFAYAFSSLSIITFLIAALFFAIIFAVSILAKKLMAHYLECSIDTKVWNFQRYGFKEKSYFKNPVPVGIILPFLITILSLGSFYWLAVTQSEITAKKSRVVKRHDFYSFSELTEFHIGLIPAAGIIACLILGFLSYFINQPELGKLAIFFASFNMIPLGNLDGTKIFFGSLKLWFFLAALCLIAFSYALFLI